MRRVSSWLFALAFGLLHSMLAVAAVNYTCIFFRGLWNGSSLPASSAWGLAAPLGVAAAVSLILGLLFRRRTGEPFSLRGRALLFVIVAAALSLSLVVVTAVSYEVIACWMEQAKWMVSGVSPLLSLFWCVPFGAGILLALGQVGSRRNFSEQETASKGSPLPAVTVAAVLIVVVAAYYAFRHQELTELGVWAAAQTPVAMVLLCLIPCAVGMAVYLAALYLQEKNQ